MIEKIQQKLAEKSIKLLVTEPAYLLLVEQGYDSEHGARPLRHAVQCLLEDLLAGAILQGELSFGDIVEVDVSGCHLCLRAFDYQGQDIA